MAEAAVPVAGGTPGPVPPPSQVRQWGSLRRLSSVLSLEAALANRPFERMPWLAVAMFAGICAWFALPAPGEWLIFIGLCGVVGSLTGMTLSAERFPFLRTAIVSATLFVAAGLAIAWVRSELVGTAAIGRPIVAEMTVQVLKREERAGNDATRIVIATGEATGEWLRARLTLPERFDDGTLTEGATATMRVRLMPPSRASVPGAYDFAEVAWFDRIAATGSVLSQPQILSHGARSGTSWVRDRLATDVRNNMLNAGGEPSAGVVATTLIAGQRLGMAAADAQAIRDAGLAHLLSISGLHVGAVVAICWVVVMRVLALWPWLALRVPLPLAASAIGAIAAVGYTILTGAAVPTIRACLAALLVLAAMALGRQALSMRLVATAAIAVMLLRPEAAMSPSFQLSFAAVIAIVALHNAAPVSAFREAGRQANAGERLLRFIGLLFLTGLVIELALMPLVLFHFYRAGLYGAAANLVAIPLTTLVIMPLLGLALVFDMIGAGAPFWWLSAKAIGALLAIARETASAPGAVGLTPLVPAWIVCIVAGGGFWLALWSGKGRLAGLLPIGAGALALATIDAPDMMVSGDGRHVALRGEEGKLYLLRMGDSFNRRILVEMAGISHDAVRNDIRPIEEWPNARCNPAFCALQLFDRNGRVATDVLIARGRVSADRAALATACRASDIVVAESALPQSCSPRWLKLDGRELSRRGGAAIDVSARTVRHVRPKGDRHGW